MLFLPFVEVVPEYQRVAVFRLGRMAGYRGPGVVYRLPFLERLASRLGVPVGFVEIAVPWID